MFGETHLWISPAVCLRSIFESVSDEAENEEIKILEKIIAETELEAAILSNNLVEKIRDQKRGGREVKLQEMILLRFKVGVLKKKLESAMKKKEEAEKKKKDQVLETHLTSILKSLETMPPEDKEEEQPNSLKEPGTNFLHSGKQVVNYWTP